MSLINCTGRAWILVVLTFSLFGALALAQNRQGVPDVAAPDRPVVLHTSDVARIRLIPVATGLDHPWGVAFRANGDILITERDKGTLRVVRNGQLLERPNSRGSGGLRRDTACRVNGTLHCTRMTIVWFI